MITVEKIIRAFEEFRESDHVGTIYRTKDCSKTEIQLQRGSEVCGLVIFDELENKIFITETTIKEIL